MEATDKFKNSGNLTYGLYKGFYLFKRSMSSVDEEIEEFVKNYWKNRQAKEWR